MQGNSLIPTQQEHDAHYTVEGEDEDEAEIERCPEMVARRCADMEARLREIQEGTDLTTNMTNIEKAEQLELAAKILREGLEWEFCWRANIWNTPYHELGVAACLGQGYTIRIKPWTPPASPEGKVWHRPIKECWEDGKRALLSDEQPQQKVDEFKWPEGSRWEKLHGLSERVGPSPNWYFRTTRPLPPIPTPPVMVPLEAADVPVGSAIREIGSHPHCWLGVASVLHDRVHVYFQGSLQTFYTWSFLKEKFEILRPGSDWQHCEKPTTPTNEKA